MDNGKLLSLHNDQSGGAALAEWDVATGGADVSELQEGGRPEPIACMQLPSDHKGSVVALLSPYGSDVKFWDAAARRVTRQLEYPAPAGTAITPTLDTNSFHWSTVTSRAVLAMPDQVAVYELASGKLLYTIQFPSADKPVFMTPDGHLLAPAGGEEEFAYVVLDDEGRQQTLTPAQFAQAYGWKNDPDLVRKAAAGQYTPPARLPRGGERFSPSGIGSDTDETTMRRAYRHEYVERPSANAQPSDDEQHRRIEAAPTTNLATDVNSSVTKLTRDYPGLGEALNKSAGYAVFPFFSTAGSRAGAAFGRGLLFENGHRVGYCDVVDESAGSWLGNVTCAEVVVFESRGKLDAFKAGTFRFQDRATAVMLKPGVDFTSRYKDGAAAFVMPRGGLIAEVPLPGQKFGYNSLADGDLEQPPPGPTTGGRR